MGNGEGRERERERERGEGEERGTENDETFLFSRKNFTSSFKITQNEKRGKKKK